MGIVPPGQAADRQAAISERTDQGGAQEAAAAGHQHMA